MRAWLWLAVAGCAGEKDEDSTTCSVSVDDGVIEASIEGDAWDSTATWSEAGEGVQVVSGTADGWRMTIAAQQALAAVDVGEFPFVIDLAGDEGFVTAYPESGGASFSSSEGSGTLTLTGADGDLLSGCFSAELGSADGDTLSVSGAEFVAGSL